MNKYNAKKTIIDGIEFASIKESKRYRDLKLMEKAGLITDLVTHPQYELLPKQKGERKAVYTADFRYTENGVEIVEDAKSEPTRKKPDYVLRRKLMLWVHGIEIREV